VNEPTAADVLAWLRDGERTTPLGAPAAPVTPSQIMSRFRSGHNAACRLLEALEADGELVKVEGPALAWRLAQPPQRPGKGYSLPLSPAEHAALLRLLDRIDGYLYIGSPIEEGPAPRSDPDAPTLCALLSRLKRP
jgi:hypothetical protein